MTNPNLIDVSKPMTQQEVFNAAIEALAKQGRRSVTQPGAGGCVYRGPEGACCAFGFFIPEDVYDPEMEGSIAETVIQNDGFPAWMKDQDMMRMFERLQNAHDLAYLSYEDKFSTSLDRFGKTVRRQFADLPRIDLSIVDKYFPVTAADQA